MTGLRGCGRVEALEGMDRCGARRVERGAILPYSPTARHLAVIHEV